MEAYISLVREILEQGEKKDDRTRTGTISVFGAQRKYDLRKGFPLVTTKKVLFDAVIRELLWFLKGSTNINEGLKEYTPIWNAWAQPDGSLGPVYGYQWRKWEKFEPIQGVNEQKITNSIGVETSIDVLYKKSHIDQISQVVEAIKKNPNSRRLIVSAWNASDIDRMKLPPCHLLFQFYVGADRDDKTGRRLDCQLYQRSADIALGVPFNIASYAALMHMIAQECGLTPGIFTHTLGDAHIYLNHVEGMQEQLTREPYPLPTLTIAKKPLFDLKFEDFKLDGYQHHPFIKFPIAV